MNATDFRTKESGMPRWSVLVYGAVSYLIFLASFVYAVGFVGNVVVPKGIDDGAIGSVSVAIAVNLVLLSLFAIQHSVMARPAFKRWWTQIVPPPAERSTYVLASSLVLILLFWQWRPLPEVVWQVENLLGRGVAWSLFCAGWCVVLLSTFLINHFDLFGLRQVYLYATGQPYTSLRFRTPSLYRLVRHPIMLGFVIAFWATPSMSQGHLMFAAVTTAYILVAIQLEERDLLAYHGQEYAGYRQQVRMLLPIPKPGPRRAP